MSNIDKKHIIKHFRTSTSGHVVSPDNIEIGEIAMNYNSESPMLMFKDNEGNIQKVGSVLNVTGSSEYHTMSQKSITDAINDKFDSIEIPEVALSESYEEISYPEISDENIVFNPSLKGDSLDTAVNKLDSNISLLVSEVLDNEIVIAAAFTEFKENIGLDENLKYVSDKNANFISGATTFAEADSLLDAAIEEVRSSVPSLENYYNKSEVNELIDDITAGDIQLANYYTKVEVDALIPSVPTSNTAFTNDAGYITLSEVPETDLSEYAKKSELEGLASETYVGEQISNLVSGAPSMLDTLDELAKALNDDANFATTVTNQIAEKADKDHTHAFASITDKPTTLGGYGIIDAKIEGKTIILGDNSLDVSDTILSESYEEISYPEVSDSVIFNPSLKGDSLDTAVNKLDSNISLLVSEVLKDETVMAAAFAEIKENVGLDGNLKYVPNESANFIGGAATFAEADSLLDAALKDHTHTFASITDKPTTLGGYGIVDAKIEGKTITLGENSLDVSEAVLSESYVSVVYDSDTGDKTFTPAVARQTLDEAIYAVESNVSTLVTSVLENEEVTSAAITEVKVSVGLDENLKYVTNSSAAYISSATNVSEALNILDNAVLNVFDNMPDVSVDAYTKSESDSKYALKTALDASNQTINSLQTSLNAANQTIGALQTTIGTLESKINAIISAVGLNNNGTFIVPTTAQTSGYTTAATSVMSAIHLMDNQIEENETVSAYALTDLNNRLNEYEKVNATALTDLNERLNEEINRVNEYEEVNATALTDLNERITTLEIS